MAKASEIKVKDLPGINRSHLAWRLDAKTVCGYVTACYIAKCNGDWGEKTLYEIFIWLGRSPHSAKIHSKKVVNFKLPITNL